MEVDHLLVAVTLDGRYFVWFDRFVPTGGLQRLHMPGDGLAAAGLRFRRAAHEQGPDERMVECPDRDRGRRLRRERHLEDLHESFFRDGLCDAPVASARQLSAVPTAGKVVSKDFDPSTFAEE